ncbi:uncharacterized protein LOC143208013 isoform X3 [Lasioglossum baleicum]|uniref:uncharacterized protein LOC143208013 isoform X3 n=1 Tax=Lasioglossum baleicum TaxID=434251 RepID=UPI003FCED80E
MSCNVTPLKKYAEISYRVKCVSVENERVFGDVYVTQQTRNLLYCADGYQFPSLYARRKCNLIQRDWQGPDFMELNKKKPIRRASIAPAKPPRKCLKRSKSVGDTRHMAQHDCKNNGTANTETEVRNPKTYPSPLPDAPSGKERSVSSLVDQLLLDIYGLPDGDRGRSESDSTASSLKARPQHRQLQKARLLWKSTSELQILIRNLRDHINHTGSLLIRQLRRKDYLSIKREKQCDIITAYLQAYSRKHIEDTKMRFSLTPQPGESGFIQWLDAMKMVARLQGGIPPEFRKKLWLTLAERHLEQRGVDWKQAEKVCFNEWSNPDDEELGIQIVKDLHRTGCSLFCGAAGRDNQAVLRRVLLGFARWNKSVGYCQGLNVLAALVLQVMDRAESAAVKVMIYLIEGVLPEGYFADNLRGLSVDMAVFRDLLRTRLPKLSKHLEALQNDAKDKATGSSYEPPLTNVFTMQWFLTLFCHCLPQEAVLRVWDLIFLEGDEILLRTALTIWEGLSDRIMTVTSADEFYSIMGVLTREMLEFTDTNNLIKNIVSMGPLQGVTGLREKHRYNITPWARKLSDDDDSDTEEDERLAVAAAMFSMAQRLKKDMLVDRIPQTIGALQAMAPSSDRERLALDISTLKQQYAKLRERQRQAHIILSAACARQTMVPPPTSQAMNHLLVGKNALVSAKNRPLSLPSGTAQAKTRPTPLSQNRRDRQGITLHWKDTMKAKQKAANASGPAEAAALQPLEAELASPKRSNGDSDSDSTSTELCDEPDRLSDVDSEDLTSASESYVMATDEEKISRGGGSPMPEKSLGRSSSDDKSEPASVDNSKQDLGLIEENLGDMSIAKITDQIRRLSAEDDNNSMVPQSFSARSKNSPDDSLMTVQSSMEKNRSAADLSTDFTLDTSVRKSLALDEYDYLGLRSSTINVKDEEVLVHESHKSKGPAKETEDFAGSLKDLKDPGQEATSTSVQHQGSSALAEYPTSLGTKYDQLFDQPSPVDTSYEKITTEKADSMLDTKQNDVADKTVSSDAKYGTVTATTASSDTRYDKIADKTSLLDRKYGEMTEKSILLDRKYDDIADKATSLDTKYNKTGDSTTLQAKLDQITDKAVSLDAKYDKLLEKSSLIKTEMDVVTEKTFDVLLDRKFENDSKCDEIIIKTAPPDTKYEKLAGPISLNAKSDTISNRASPLDTKFDKVAGIAMLLDTKKDEREDTKYDKISSKSTSLDSRYDKIIDGAVPSDTKYNKSSSLDAKYDGISSFDTKYDKTTEKVSLDTKYDIITEKVSLETKYDKITEKASLDTRYDKTAKEVSLDTKYDQILEKTSPLDLKFDKIPGKPVLDLGCENGERYKSTFDFSSRISLDSNTYKPAKTSPIVEQPSSVGIERNLYCKTYIGHLPISPVTVDQKLSQLTSVHGVNIITPLVTDSANTQVLEKPYFMDRIQSVQTKTYSDLKKSPQTPESNKSFSSGETMGPDTKPSSMTISPRTPVRSDSRDYLMDKSVSSSVSSDSKTLVFRSGDSDVTRDSDKTDMKRASFEKSSSLTPISTDSLRLKSETSPKLIVSSSSDSCSPGKMKSSERSFSSDLQSPISANSIKYTSNYNRHGQDNLSGSPMDLSAATSPFYPISNPNQKTPPSPYSVSRQRSGLDSTETSPEQKSSSSKESNKYLGYQSKFDSSLKSDIKDTGATRKEEYRREYNTKKEVSSDRRNGDSDVHYYQSSSSDYYRRDKDLDDGGDDPLSEKDVVPSLPLEKLDKHYLNYNYRHRDKSKMLERSSSSLESRRFVDMKSSVSSDEFNASMVKKRSSDILEDIKHLEAKASEGSSDSGILTKKSYMWEDLKSLEARRQDTFSDSASTFSKRRLEIPDISVTGEGRKSYIVHPMISIDENADSILNTVARSQNNGDSDDGRESKLGVWTKVKPRKRGDNGRRNSDRALKIIQENSVILQKILACQAKKRLPDLEEISKEISISPINEEISKIFSPILEKMGLNEHEINEELARINFKDFDNMTATSVSEFDAKINEELSRLSLIDDNEHIDHFGVDEVIAHQYSDRREALIDRKINEELSKLLLNYEDRSPASIVNLEKGSSQNISEIDGLDLSSISTNVFSYKSSNDSIDTRSDLTTQQEPTLPVEKFSQYTEKVLPYNVSKYRDDDSSPKSDIDIYRELEKLDQISSAQVLPHPILELPQKELSSIPYVPNTSPFDDVPPIRYTTKPVQYDTSPLKSTYDPYKTFEFTPKLSPKHATTNPFVAASYDQPVIDTTFEYINNKPDLSVNAYDTHLKSPMLTKEALEFRVRYEEEPSRDIGTDYMSLPSDLALTLRKSPYYSNGNTEPLTPTKYVSEERCLDPTGSSFMEYTGEPTDLRRKYEPLSPKEYSHKSAEYDRHLLPSIEATSELGSYLPTKHLDYHALSPSHQFIDQHFSAAANHYGSKLSPGFADETKRPVSHPEFPGKITIGKYTELPDRGVASSYQKSSLSLGNIGHSSKGVENNYNTLVSPKAQFSPFPVRNAPRKPNELTLKLGLYPQKSPDMGQLKRS